MRLYTEFLFSLLLFSYISHAAPVSQDDEGAFTSSGAKKLTTLADALSGNFSYSESIVQWIPAGNYSDGTYVVQDSSTLSLMLWDIAKNASSVFVDATELGIDYEKYIIQPSGKHVLFSGNATLAYRGSYIADYYVWSVESKTLVPLVEGQSGDVQSAMWSPHGDVIAYVRGGDLFIWKDGVSTRATNDGGGNVFNGAPAGINGLTLFFGGELGLLGQMEAFWFSPDGEYLAFLKFNETE
ncbi:unnamed protein product, partial [Tuber aestivum]